MMERKQITACSDEELKVFAETVLQLDLTGANTRPKIVAALGQSGWEHDWVMVDADKNEEGDAVAVAAQIVYDTGRDDGPPVKLKILETDMPGGRHPAHPDVNGRMLVVQRNMTVEIPYAFYLALKNAISGSVQQGPDRDGRPGELITTNVTNYPMSEVELPTQAEIEAWHARNGSRALAA